MPAHRTLSLLLLSLSLAACSGVTFSIPRPEAGAAQGGTPFPGSNTQGPAGQAKPSFVPPSDPNPEAKEEARKTPSTPNPKEDQAILAALAKVRSGKAGYKVRPGDLLEISVFQEKDLDRKLRVGPDGVITYPLAGKVAVGGLDTPAAEAALAVALQKYLINPQVSIFVSEYSSSLVYILGEVRAPGSFPIPGDRPMTVLEAITQAGGFTQYAAQERTRVIRNVEGRSETLNVNVRAITTGDKNLDIKLEPNDVIFVPESFF